MEIEEMKVLWSEMSFQLEQQKKLTNEIIMNMTQERYKNKFRTVSIVETFGAIICYISAGYILVNFPKLNNWLEISCGIFVLCFLIVMPILVLKSLYGIQHLNIIERNIKETLVDYLTKKKQLLQFQKIGIYACFILMFAQLPVASKILANKDFLEIMSVELYIGIIIATIVLFFYARWGYNHYLRLTNAAENILKELE